MSACRRAHRRIRIALKKAHAFLSNAIDARRLDIRTAVAGDVGVAKVVGHDEDDVGRPGGRLRKEFFGARRERQCPESGLTQYSTASNFWCGWHMAGSIHCRKC